MLASEVTTFLDQNIQSYEELEVLLLLRSGFEKPWDAVDVAEQLRMEPFSASQYLAQLHQRGLLDHDGKRGLLYQYQYDPRHTSVEKNVSLLAGAFEKARQEVFDYLFTNNRKQLRSLADAFKIKKDY